jgi:hypothetical protein
MQLFTTTIRHQWNGVFIAIRAEVLQAAAASRGYNWANLFLGDARGPDPSSSASLKCESAKYGHESRGTRTRE